MTPFYGFCIVDTLTVDNHTNLFVIAGNTTSFSSALFMLDLKTGKRLPGILWCSGHLTAMSANLLNGMFPTTDTYSYPDVKIADLMFGIRIPKNDYQIYWGMRTPGFGAGGLSNNLTERNYQILIENIAGREYF